MWLSGQDRFERLLFLDDNVEERRTSWRTPEVGCVSRKAMFNTFNMGIGLVVIVSSDYANRAIDFFQEQKLPTYRIGEIIEGNGEVVGLYRSEK